MIKNVLKVSAIVLIFGLASGCVSQASVDRAQATADGAARDAAAAKSAAEAARAASDGAAEIAAAAVITADLALIAAAEAQSCCDANRDRLERMFQKSMQK